MNRDERGLDEAGKKHVVNIQRCVIIFLSLSLFPFIYLLRKQRKKYLFMRPKLSHWYIHSSIEHCPLPPEQIGGIGSNGY